MPQYGRQTDENTTMMEEASCLLYLPTHIFAPGSGKEVESMF
jgi:hypothetical protein